MKKHILALALFLGSFHVSFAQQKSILTPRETISQTQSSNQSNIISNPARAFVRRMKSGLLIIGPSLLIFIVLFTVVTVQSKKKKK